jgi:ribose-phosphate pyrophosphokinase
MIVLNGTELNIKAFPNNETLIDSEQIKALLRAKNRLVLKYKTDADLIHLMFVKNYIDTLEKNNDTILFITYMPYSRMDRSENDSVFTLKYVSNFINSLNFTCVYLIEPHSDVSMALVDRSNAISPTLDMLRIVKDIVGFDPDTDCLFFPDAGAQKRYSKTCEGTALVGFKDRDFKSGNIKSLELVGEVPKRGFKAIIVDDLCSKGGTFMMAAEKLITVGAEEVYLLVTHCEETIYQGKIFETSLINKVFTTDSIIDESKNEKLNIIRRVI